MESQERCEVPGAASESETTSGSKQLANNGERMRWLAERERVACQAARMPDDQGGPLGGRGGLWRRCSACSSAVLCLEFASRAPSVAPYRTVAEPAPLHATLGLLYVETGRTWYVAVCTPHRLLSAMSLLFIMSGRRCKHCCLCQSLGSRSFSL